MKSLYESILDDEDILVSNLKKDANPVLMLYNLYMQYNDWKKISIDDIQNIIKLLDNGYFTDFNLIAHVDIYGTLEVCNSKNNKALYTFSPTIRRYKLCITPSEEVNNGWKTKRNQKRYFDELFKRYNITYDKHCYNIFNVYYILN